ncbi:unnamed protein product [Camellia sinensis]
MGLLKFKLSLLLLLLLIGGFTCQRPRVAAARPLSSFLPQQNTQNYLQHWEWTASVVMAQKEENAQVHGLSHVLNSNAFLGSYISIVVYM